MPTISPQRLFHGFGTLLAADSVLVLIGVIALDNYSGMLTLMTAVDSFRKLTSGKKTRTAFVGIMTAMWVVVTLLGGQNAMTALTLALTAILYLLVPWTAVNLIDFFFTRRGHYAVTEIFNPDGIYGRWAGWRVMRV